MGQVSHSLRSLKFSLLISISLLKTISLHETATFERSKSSGHLKSPPGTNVELNRETNDGAPTKRLQNNNVINKDKKAVLMFLTCDCFHLRVLLELKKQRVKVCFGYVTE